MFKLRAAWILVAAIGALNAQTSPRADGTPQSGSKQDEADVRSILAEGFEKYWNNHQPAAAVTPDKCIDDAIFINTTGGWVRGRENFAAMISRLHAPGGPFHDHTRRHVVEELRFIRPDVVVAVVKTFDKKRAGVPVTGEETRGLTVLTKEGGSWKVNALQNTRIQTTVNGQR
jgi:ketosteroid isomerase-like protein